MTRNNSFLERVGFPISCSEFIDNDQFLLAGGGGSSRSGVKNELRLYQIKNKTLVLKMKADLTSGDDAPTSLSYNKEFDVFACGINGSSDKIIKGENESLKLGKMDKDKMDITQSKRIIENNSLNDYQRVTLFNKEGSLLFISSAEGQVSLFNYPELTPKVNGKQCINEEISDGDIDSEDRYYATASDKVIHFFNVKDGSLAHNIEAPSSLNKVSCKFRNIKFGKEETKDNFYLAINSKDRKRSYISKFDIDTFEKEIIRPLGFSPICSFAISYDGKFLAVACADQSIRICDSNALRVLETYKEAHTFAITTLSFSKDGKYLISGSADGTCRIFTLPEKFENNDKKFIFNLFFIILLLLGVLFFIVSAYSPTPENKYDEL
ncbi:WD40 repeat-like protein [Neoconidiobolus thromboides FSU 785]|nr:WD40 repeat-like protein [Neoconidiobolus thromboides FSU 785]